jgi:Bacterial Ig domain
MSTAHKIILTQPRAFLSSLVLLGSLGACQDPNEKIAPRVSITQPANAQTVTGTVPIQIDAVDESGIANVKVYAHAKGSSVKGLLIGSAVSRPFVISWATSGAAGMPNNADLELQAMAVDKNGNEGISTPVAVRTQNPGTPSLNLLACFTYPPQVVTASIQPDPRERNARAVLPASLSSISALSVKPPINARILTNVVQSRTSSRASGDRKFVQQWEWLPVTGVEGYGIYSSSIDLAGPYELVRKQAASAGAAPLEKFPRFMTTVGAGSSLFGAITTVSNNNSTESGKSNADGCTFLPAQDSGLPNNDAVVSDGRPTLTWTANPAASGVLNGYQFYVYDGDPFGVTIPKLLWTNYPTTSDKLVTSYPLKDAQGVTINPLPKGTYYWMVAVVTFDALSKADGFSYSEPKKFIVP